MIRAAMWNGRKRRFASVHKAFDLDRALNVERVISTTTSVNAENGR